MEDGARERKETAQKRRKRRTSGVAKSGNIVEEAFVRRKPFCLEPIPSFHEQNVHRVRTHHVDIVQMPVIEYNQKRQKYELIWK